MVQSTSSRAACCFLGLFQSLPGQLLRLTVGPPPNCCSRHEVFRVHHAVRPFRDDVVRMVLVLVDAGFSLLEADFAVASVSWSRFSTTSCCTAAWVFIDRLLRPAPRILGQINLLSAASEHLSPVCRSGSDFQGAKDALDDQLVTDPDLRQFPLDVVFVGPRAVDPPRGGISVGRPYAHAPVRAYLYSVAHRRWISPGCRLCGRGVGGVLPQRVGVAGPSWFISHRLALDSRLSACCSCAPSSVVDCRRGPAAAAGCPGLTVSRAPTPFEAVQDRVQDSCYPAPPAAVESRRAPLFAKRSLVSVTPSLGVSWANPLVFSEVFPTLPSVVESRRLFASSRRLLCYSWSGTPRSTSARPV